MCALVLTVIRRGGKLAAWITPFGEMRHGGFSLCPADSGSLDLVRGLYDALLPHFTSRMFNVGCNGTFDLGQGRSPETCRTLGRGRVHRDFLLKITCEVRARSRHGGLADSAGRLERMRQDYLGD